jgi:hypothetical protein
VAAEAAAAAQAPSPRAASGTPRRAAAARAVPFGSPKLAHAQPRVQPQHQPQPRRRSSSAPRERPPRKEAAAAAAAARAAAIEAAGAARERLQQQLALLLPPHLLRAQRAQWRPAGAHAGGAVSPPGSLWHAGYYRPKRAATGAAAAPARAGSASPGRGGATWTPAGAAGAGLSPPGSPWYADRYNPPPKRAAAGTTAPPRAGSISPGRAAATWVPAGGASPGRAAPAAAAAAPGWLSSALATAAGLAPAGTALGAARQRRARRMSEGEVQAAAARLHGEAREREARLLAAQAAAAAAERAEFAAAAAAARSPSPGRRRRAAEAAAAEAAAAAAAAAAAGAEGTWEGFLLRQEVHKARRETRRRAEAAARDEAVQEEFYRNCTCEGAPGGRRRARRAGRKPCSHRCGAGGRGGRAPLPSPRAQPRRLLRRRGRAEAPPRGRPPARSLAFLCARAPW